MAAEFLALNVAVVGHTNAGKTSLLRTLTRRADFGAVSDRPGTTRHVEAITLDLDDGEPALCFVDTPGLEDAVALLDHLHGLDAALPRAQRLQAFLQGGAAKSLFEQEAKVLRALLQVDAGLLVIDAREDPALPKFAAELEILMLGGRPLMPVLNFVREPTAQEGGWRALLAAHGLHALLRFDVVAPFVGAEAHLYGDLGALLPERRAQLAGVVAFLERERAARRSASLRLIAASLLGLAAYREAAPGPQLDDEYARMAFVRAFRQTVNARLQISRLQLLALHGFGAATAEAAELPQLAGRWEADLFNPELLKQAGRQFGTGAALGGAIGVVADVALAGLSLGAAATLGATIGGLASQGLGQVGRRLGNKLRGLLELSLEDAALLQIAAQHLTLLLGLERRGHAALEVMREQAGMSIEPEALAALRRALRPARGHPEWAGVGARPGGADEARVLAALASALAAQPDDAQSPSSISAASATPARPAGRA